MTALLEEITFVGLFTLGILTSFSPCSIAILLAFLSYVVGVSRTVRKGLLIGLTFTLGLSIILFIIGFAVSYVGVLSRSQRIFYGVAGALFILFGLNNLGAFEKIKIPKPKSSLSLIMRLESFQNLRLAAINKFSKYHYLVGSLALGLVLGLVWGPCSISLIFPVLILVMAQATTPLYGGALLFTFGLGHGIPIILASTALVGVREIADKRFALAGLWFKKIFGIILIAVSVWMFLIFFNIPLEEYAGSFVLIK